MASKGYGRHNRALSLDIRGGCRFGWLLWTLENEAYNRETFCIALYELIPRLDYHENLKQTFFKIKMRRRIGVIIIYGKYLETFSIGATEKDLQGKTSILGDGNTIEETFPLHPRFLILSTKGVKLTP